MENPGLGPGQPRKGSPVLGLARWAALQALGEAESQAALSQLLWRAGTSLQQPSQVRAMKNLRKPPSPWAIGVLGDEAGCSLQH